MTRNSAFRLAFVLLVASARVSLGEPAQPTAVADSKESAILIEDGDRLAFLGNSITAGGASYGGYCRMVVHGLKSRDIRVEPILAGVPGNTSADMLERLATAVLDHEPNWVVLAAGVNDVWHGDPTVKIGVFQPKPGMGVKLPEYKQNVTAIVDRCTKAGARVMLTTITPIREEPDFKLNATAREYNTFLRELAKERGLPIADLHGAMFSEIAGGRRLTSDGVHPLPAGHRVMARGLLETMGFSAAEATALEREWEAAPYVLILGDRQTTSGSRTGGWIHLLLDGLNSGREMVTHRSHAQYRKEVTVSSLLKDLDKHLEDKPRTLILQAPKDDAVLATPMDDYRRAIEELIGIARARKAKLILSTIAIPEKDAAGGLRKKIEPYNRALRELATAKGVPLADVSKAMDAAYAEDPQARLMFDGERFNREGSILMVEAILQAMGRDSLITPELRRTWEERPAYFKRYQ